MNIVACALAAHVLVSGAPGSSVLLDKVVATVNEDIVTLSELRAAARPFLDQNPGEEGRFSLYSDVMEQLINEKLISQQIDEAKIDVSEAEIKAAVEDILRQNNLTRDQLMQALQARAMSLDQYKSDLKSQIIRLKLVDMKVRSRVVVPENDLRAEYDIRTRDEIPKTKVGIAHILLRYDDGESSEDRARVLERAGEVRTRVTTGKEEFAEVAKELSQGPTAARGGSLGVLDEEALLPELAKAIRTLQPGEISSPIETDNGVHVVKLESRALERSKSFDDMKAKIYQDLYERRVDEQMKIWLNEVRQSSAVDVRLNKEDVL